uniref:DNA mismatch repair proteins mutS family domain-containing protein n=1 Tax=viral metagenome TaxID=1070528 RepID=A0A6C0I0C2_9ZZZZ
MNIFFTKNQEEEILKKELTQFKLPISYISDNLHSLPQNVATDLELDQLIKTSSVRSKDDATESEKPIYHYIFQPKHKFAEKTIPLWKKHFTSNQTYLNETQNILQNMRTYKKNMDIHKLVYSPNYEKIMNVWQNTKENKDFLEKYSYMDVEWFKFLNRMPSFLQTMSFVNMTSPILALIIPFIFLLAPFIILKIQGVPISFTVYIDTLCDLAKYHFIGKAVTMLRNFNAQNLVYFIMMICFYGYQCYTNYTACIRFYRNIREMNDQIIEMRNYLDYSIESMKQFVQLSENCQQYDLFNSDLFYHMDNLILLRQILSKVAKFEPSLGKVTEIGLLLRCFYEIHENYEIGNSIHWSFGFEGYMNNLLGIHENLCENRVNYTKYGSQKQQILAQYYPAHMHESYVSNDCNMDKNMVITGPNAAGKTTFLKTTILNVLFSQQFGCGFFKSCELEPYTHIHSYLNIPDTSARDSLFQAESRRCKEILDAINNDSVSTSIENKRHFCIFDELYSGTNPEEATKSAFAFLNYLSKYENVDFILTTHYVSVCKRLQKVPTVRNWRMEAMQNADGEIRYTYKIGRGISKIQGAFSVLRDMGYPAEILQTIRDYDSVSNKKRKNTKN